MIHILSRCFFFFSGNGGNIEGGPISCLLPLAAGAIKGRGGRSTIWVHFTIRLQATRLFARCLGAEEVVQEWFIITTSIPSTILGYPHTTHSMELVGPGRLLAATMTRWTNKLTTQWTFNSDYTPTSSTGLGVGWLSSVIRKERK